MVRLTLLILATLSGQYVDAFVPASFHRGAIRQQTFSIRSAVDENDVMAPSDNAIRKAYDDWRAKYSKGSFNSARFETFKSNYQAIADANIKAKDMSAPKLTLNEFGDFTAEEYEALKANSVSSSSSAQSTSVAVRYLD
jgi:Cathepsin propeptide inhibitor domain (I29)